MAEKLIKIKRSKEIVSVINDNLGLVFDKSILTHFYSLEEKNRYLLDIVLESFVSYNINFLKSCIYLNLYKSTNNTGYNIWNSIYWNRSKELIANIKKMLSQINHLYPHRKFEYVQPISATIPENYFEEFLNKQLTSYKPYLFGKANVLQEENINELLKYTDQTLDKLGKNYHFDTKEIFDELLSTILYFDKIAFYSDRGVVKKSLYLFVRSLLQYLLMYVILAKALDSHGLSCENILIIALILTDIINAINDTFK